MKAISKLGRRLGRALLNIWVLLELAFWVVLAFVVSHPAIIDRADKKIMYFSAGSGPHNGKDLWEWFDVVLVCIAAYFLTAFFAG